MFHYFLFSSRTIHSTKMKFLFVAVTLLALGSTFAQSQANLDRAKEIESSINSSAGLPIVGPILKILSETLATTVLTTLSSLGGYKTPDGPPLSDQQTKAYQLDAIEKFLGPLAPFFFLVASISFSAGEIIHKVFDSLLPLFHSTEMVPELPSVVVEANDKHRAKLVRRVDMESFSSESDE